ncbi:hypothetical protein, partial [Microcoleus sp. T3_D1]|uniref:hypothetical protein n=1 Tax=Microcoleus sp. T3_D1 TaxID=3055427 RepID=UPI002FD5B057
MPVPQKNIKLLVGWASSPPEEQARCLFHKKTSSFLWGGLLARPKNRQDACSTKKHQVSYGV